MTTRRLKTAASTIRTREEMEALVGDIATLKIEEQMLTAGMNEKIAEIRARYEADLGEIDAALKGKMALARDWAEANPAAFGQGRSLALTQGVVGWRLGNPALKTIKGWTWKKVLERIKELGHTAYIRVKEEVNKDAILGDRGILAYKGLLKQIGVQVVQEETFFIEPRIDAPETRMQEAKS